MIKINNFPKFTNLPVPGSSTMSFSRLQPPNWREDAPEYHSPTGWAWEKQMAEFKLRETFGRTARTWGCIDWFLEQALVTDDVKYYRVATRLIEIEKERRD